MVDQEAAEQVWDLSAESPERLRERLTGVEVLDPDSERLPPLIELVGLDGQHGVCLRWTHPVRIRAKGDLGDYAFAWCDGVDGHVDGHAGDGLAEGLTGGVIRVTGDAGCGMGTAMTGGTLAIYGSAGPRCGAAMRGGSLFVRGDAGDHAGIAALAGTIVIGGDAGEGLGSAQPHVTVFLRGRAASLADGLIEAPLRKREQLSLGLLLMNASIRGSAKDFRRIVSESRLRAELAQQGEVRPSWR